MAPPSRGLHRQSTKFFSLAITAIGIALVVLTLSRGGGPLSLGVVLGSMFAALGVARLYLLRS